MKKFLSSLLLFLSNSCFAYTIQNCTPSQNELINSAVSRTIVYSKNVIDSKNYGIFIKWLGFNEINDIKNSFKNIKDVLQNGDVSFSCSCDLDVFALSLISDNPNNHFHLTKFCSRFWKASLNGFDSKTGTIIHELSHFPDIIGTHDHIINITKCEKAAKTREGQKIILNNANSYEYLAEELNKN